MIKYFGTKGRINRLELTFLSILIFIVFVIFYLLLDHESNIFIIISIILFILYCFQVAKRYHDLNKWGINAYVWFLIPIINVFYFFEIYFKKGTNGINKYGEPSIFSFRDITKHTNLKKENYIKAENRFTKVNDNEKLGDLKLYNIISYKAIQQYLYPKDKMVQFVNKPSPDIFNIKSVSVDFWHKRNGDYCERGDEICTLKIRRNFNDEKITIIAEEKGILKTYKDKNYGFNSNNLINDNEKIFDLYIPVDNRLFNNSIIEEDKFNKCENLKWEKVGGNNFYDKRLNGFILTVSQNSERIFFTINNLNGKDFVIINYPKKEFDLKRGNKFQILLDSDEVICLNFSQNSYQAYESYDENLKKIQENKAPITLSDLQKLANNKVINWKISFQSGQEISGISPFGNNHAYKSFGKIQEMIQLLAIDYLNEVSKIQNHKPLSIYEEINNNSTESCCIYLMADTTNGCYKIGISNKPEYRERTLQSEKPTIELVASKEFPSRQIAESIEKALHYTFKEKNIRGEWFNLSQKDINEIKETLK